MLKELEKDGRSGSTILDDMDELQDLFDAIDTDGTGTIDLSEFMNCNFTQLTKKLIKQMGIV